MGVEESALAETRTQLELELARQQGLLVETEDEMGQLDAQERLLQQHLEEARSRLYNLLTEISRRSGQQEEAGRRLQALAGLKQRNAQETLGVREQLEHLQTNSGELSKSLASMVGDREALQQRRQQFRNDLERLRRDGDHTDAELLVKRDELSRQRSRLESLEQLERSLEGYGRGVKSLLSSPEQKDRLVGVVADVLEVSPEYEVAVEAVLGTRLQTLLTQRRDTIEDAFAFLREGEGRCTFLVPGFVTSSLAASLPGTALVDLVKVKRGCEDAVRQLLAVVSLVEELQPYLEGGLAPGVILVTPQGDVLTGRGELTGGGRQSLDQGMLHKKREMKELVHQVEILAGEVTRLSGHREQVRMDLAVAEELLQKTEADLHRQELLVVDSEKDLDSLDQDVTRMR